MFGNMAATRIVHAHSRIRAQPSTGGCIAYERRARVPLRPCSSQNTGHNPGRSSYVYSEQACVRIVVLFRPIGAVFAVKGRATLFQP